MRKIRLLVLIHILALASCSKQQTDTNPINNDKVSEVLNSKIAYSQRTTVLNMLNEYEKAALWKSHLQKFLNFRKFNRKQLSAIKDVITAINPNIFIETNRSVYTGIMAKLEYNAKRVFSLKEYFVIFENYNSSVSDVEEPVSELYDDPPGGNCYCRSNSWCGSATGSDLAMCLWNDEGSSCVTTSSGCGLLGWSPCRGVCCIGVNCSGGVEP